MAPKKPPAKKPPPKKPTTVGKMTAEKSTAGKSTKLKPTGTFDGMTIQQLKEALRIRSLPVGGKKDDLITRFRDHGKQTTAVKTTAGKTTTGKTTKSKVTGIFDRMTVKQLKDALRTRGLPVGGKKDDLISRLRAHGKPSNTAAANPGPSTKEKPKKTYNVMKKEELIAAAASRGLPTGGNKADIIRRLEKADGKKPVPPPKVPKPQVPSKRPSTPESSTSDSSSSESSTKEPPITTPYQPTKPTTKQPDPTTQQQAVDYKSWTEEELRAELKRRRRLPVGNKEQLISRLEHADERDRERAGKTTTVPPSVGLAQPKPPTTKQLGPTTQEQPKKPYAAMKKDELKYKCRMRSHIASGSRDILIRRLEKSDGKKPSTTGPSDPGPSKDPTIKTNDAKGGDDDDDGSDDDDDDDNDGGRLHRQVSLVRQGSAKLREEARKLNGRDDKDKGKGTQPDTRKSPSPTKKGSSSNKRTLSPDDVGGTSSSSPKRQRKG